MLFDHIFEFTYAYTTPISQVNHLPIREIENPAVAYVDTTDKITSHSPPRSRVSRKSRFNKDRKEKQSSFFPCI